MAPFDSAEYGLAHGRPFSAESNALSKRTRASKGFFVSASAPPESSDLSSSNGFFVYIIRCADNSLYVGHTCDVAKRIKAHNDGRGALWTACRRPILLVYFEPHESEENAVARERQIKRWTHNKKLALISGDQAKLKALAKRRIR